MGIFETGCETKILNAHAIVSAAGTPGEMGLHSMHLGMCVVARELDMGVVAQQVVKRMWLTPWQSEPHSSLQQ